MKSKLLFIGHSYHKTTRSSMFITELLKDTYDIDEIAIDPANVDLEGIIDSNYDLYYVWQMDFVAPILIAAGKKVIVSPMYDGSSTMPNLHWYMLRGALFINFSYNMDRICKSYGCESELVKYFVNPEQYNVASDFTNLNAFLWQRRPREGINWELVDRTCGEQLSALHLHQVPDHKEDIVVCRPDRKLKYPVTESMWSTREDMEDIISKCNIYFAPRITEGIGMSVIEAMARGMVVIANDTPTHNEYIHNWYNGILINVNSQQICNLTNIKSIGMRARRSVELGWRNWQVQKQFIVQKIVNFANKAPKWSDELTDFTIKSSKLYYKGVSEYVSFLSDNLSLLSQLSSLKPEIYDFDRKFLNSNKNTATSSSSSQTVWTPPLKKDLEVRGGDALKRFLVFENFSLPESLGIWSENQSSKITFRLPDSLLGKDVLVRLTIIGAHKEGDLREVTIQAQSDKNYNIAITDWSQTTFDICLPKSDDGVVELSITSNWDPKLDTWPGDPRKLCVMVTAIFVSNHETEHQSKD